jgi:hypothetical protein
MARYDLSISERYGDEAPTNLHRLGGMPIGLSTADWPRWHGRPMQHAFTIDLAGLELEVPRAKQARALAVFVDSYYELDVDSSEGITVVWLTQAQIDANPETAPPSDFVAEKLPNSETVYEDGYVQELGEQDIEVEEADGEGNFGESYIGGQPAWNDETDEPEQLPEGAFVMQVVSWDFPVCRLSSTMFVFEGGAYIQAEDPESEERPVPWPEALARSRELVVLDEAPPADALQKWGGIPRGINHYDWPKGMTHIVTWVPDSTPDFIDGVALALFGRLSKASNWDDEVTFYEVHEIREDDLDEYDPEEFELPEGVRVLDERAIELRELPEGTSWRDLQARCFVGPRPAWRSPERSSAREVGDMPVLQLTEELLPVAPGRGTLHALADSYPIWHAAPGAPQATEARYEPEGTLYADDTTAAIVVGHELRFSDFSVLPERVEALERALLAALAARDLSLCLYVPGDTTTDRNGEVHGSFVLGRAVVEVEANDPGPGRIDLGALKAGLADLPPLDEAFWREALADIEGMEPPGEAGAYLLSWGPLCYAAVYAGVAASREDEHVYAFAANQDMEQEWSSEGVDGVSIEGAEFSSVSAIELSEAGLAKADKLDEPGFWLICRYD